MGSFNGQTILHNHMPLLGVGFNQNSVSLQQLLLDNNGGSPAHAMFVSYVCEWEWFWRITHPATHITIALNWKKNSGLCELPIGTSFFTGSQQVTAQGRTATLVHPPLGPDAVVVHAKLCVFVFQTFLRVVISSSNLTRQDWEGLAQSVWVQDFPLTNPAPPQLDTFGADLADFMHQVGLFPNLAQAILFLAPFDFSSAIVKLVASVPGTFNGNDAHRYGHARLRNLLANYEFMPNPTGIVYQASTIGYTEVSWLGQFLTSLVGKKIPTRTFPSSAYDIGDPKPLTKPILHILFPTKKMCEKSLANNLGVIVMSYFDTSNNIDKLKMLCKPQEFRDTAIHSKILMSLQKNGDRTVGWLYSGSHNFTVDSWGTIQTVDPPSNICHNYELGVFFPPTTPSAILENLNLPFQGVQPYKQDDEPWTISKEKKLVIRAQRRLLEQGNFVPELNYHFFMFVQEH